MPMPSSHVRLAALLALRNSIGVILTTLALVPVISIINRIFDGTWHVNWRLMLAVSGLLTAVFFAFCFITQLLEFASEETRERQLLFVFAGIMWVRGIYLAGIVLGFVLAAGTYKEGDPWWDVAIPTAFIFLGFLAWPRAIEICENEVRQRRIFFGLKRIPFREIETVVSDPTRNEAVVFGRNGLRIVHTKMHVQRERFIQQLNSFAGKDTISVGDLRQSTPTK
jgi:hypothetical protein